jgi:arylformamidase
MGFVDISLQLRPTMLVYPGEPKPEILPVRRLAGGEPANVSALYMGPHSGTHLDAPWHVLEEGPRSLCYPLEQLCGEALVIHVDDAECVRPVHLEKLPAGTERLLIRTRNSVTCSREHFSTEFVYLHPDAARAIANVGIRLLGFDYISVERFGDTATPAHHVLLKAGVAILEGLDLSRVQAGRYRLICLPMKIDADAAPARAILEPL